MTKNFIFSISLKLMGIYSFVQAIISLQGFGMFVTSYSNFAGADANLTAMYIGALLPCCFLIILCFILLFFSNKIANKLIGSNEPIGFSSGLNSKDVQSLAFSIIGVVIFLLALIRIVRFGSSILFALQNTTDPSRLFNLSHIIGLMLQLLIGAILFFGAKPLSLFWHRLKYERSSRNIDET
jgi:hypothetical protein